jgi:hypothetical protein
VELERLKLVGNLTASFFLLYTNPDFKKRNVKNKAILKIVMDETRKMTEGEYFENI